MKTPGEILEDHGFQIIQTAGFVSNGLNYAVYTHGDQYAVVKGRFNSEQLRAMADYMDEHNETKSI